MVLGLARGGVPVGWEVAAALRAPLDVFLVRKLGVPQWQELAMGALASGGGMVINDSLVAKPRNQRRAVAGRDRPRDRGAQPTRAGLPRRPAAGGRGRQDGDPRRRRNRHRCQHACRGARNPGCQSRTGRRRGAGWTGVGVQPARRGGRRCGVRDMPPGFEAVGQVFADFHQVSDDEVRELLATPTK